MKTDVILAGFGGQGMLLIGRLLSQAAMEEGKEVCWLPSYGPEMRGGTANVTVTIADEPIGSPVVSTPASAAVMNLPSFEKFADAVLPGGLLIINESLINIRSKRKDIRVMYLRANDLANSIGAKRSPNIVLLGALVALTGVVELDAAREQIKAQFGRKPQVAEVNLRAFQLGVDAALAYLHTQGRQPPAAWAVGGPAPGLERGKAKPAPKRAAKTAPKRARKPAAKRTTKTTAKRARQPAPKRAANRTTKRAARRA